jgi:hypothetical protein
MALANQAQITPRKQENSLEDDDDTSMSTDEYNQTRNDSNSPIKTRRGKLNKKTNKQTSIESIQYGPILVKPRKRSAPTLANGRKSKDQPVRINQIEEFILYECSFFVFSFHLMKNTNVNNVGIEINKQQLSVVKNEMNFVKN